MHVNPHCSQHNRYALLLQLDAHRFPPCCQACNEQQGVELQPQSWGSTGEDSSPHLEPVGDVEAVGLELVAAAAGQALHNHVGEHVELYALDVLSASSTGSIWLGYASICARRRGACILDEVQ